jgi:GTP-binding protein EngB required for normal cell division
MHDALIDLIERAESSIALSRGVVDDAVVDSLTEVVALARLRLQYPEELTVVGLAGGTGSGKSSLFNVLTGGDHAEVGVTRPVTSRPMAAVAGKFRGAIGSFLEGVGIDEVIAVEEAGSYCLIDLPDTDSVETDHRHRVETVMPRVDLMVWVVDPEKYRDAALHRRYLQPLAEYSSQFLVVLNQIDRLDGGELDHVLTDLREALSEDGFDDAPVVATAAAPAAGPPVGIDRLRGALDEIVGRGPALYRKVIADLDTAAHELTTALGGSLDYDKRAAMATDEAAARLIEGNVGGAVVAVTDLIEALAAETGGPMGERLLALMSGVPEALREAPAPATPEPEKRRRWRGRSVAPADNSEEARAVVASVLAPVRGMVEERARARATVVDFALAVGSVARHQSR